MFAKKLTDKSIMLALVLLGAVILILVYFVPYKNTTDEISVIEAENRSLEDTLASLQTYYDNRAIYVQETAELQKEITVLASSYPSGYRPEDYIMEAVAMQNNADDIVYSAVAFNGANSIATIDQATVAGANIENLNEKIEFIEQDVVYQNDIDYISLKQVLAEILSSSYCANIKRITYVTNQEDGRLSGDIELGYFYVTGTGVEYTAPTIPVYAQGTDNIFGHYESLLEDEEEGLE